MRLLLPLAFLLLGCTSAEEAKPTSKPVKLEYIYGGMKGIVVINGVLEQTVEKRPSTGLKVGEWELDLTNVPVYIPDLIGRKVRVFGLEGLHESKRHGNIKYVIVTYIETIDQ